jgi:secreted trypsin-like serine protease
MRSTLCKVYLCIFIFPNTIVDSKAHFRIIGGEKTEEDEYPWFYRSNGCGGSLIAADIVLTAAHCSSSYEVDDTFAAQYIHPRYFESDSHVGNDFMVVKLNEPLEDVTPVPLDTGEASFKYEQNQSLWALGV